MVAGLRRDLRVCIFDRVAGEFCVRFAAAGCRGIFWEDVALALTRQTKAFKLAVKR